MVGSECELLTQQIVTKVVHEGYYGRHKFPSEVLEGFFGSLYIVHRNSVPFSVSLHNSLAYLVKSLIN